MQKLSFGFIFVLLFQISNAQLLHEKGMRIEHTSYNEAFEKARKENKNFFIDCYTTWCGPCKMMAKNTFTDDTVGMIFNHFFINYKQDMEHNEGPQLAPIFHIEAYPTFLFIKPNGDIFHRAMGYMPPKQFIETTIAALGADANLDSLIARSKKGKISNHDMVSILLLSKYKNLDYEKYLNDYFNMQPQRNWNSIENFEIIKDYSQNILAPEVQYLIKNKADFEKINGKQEVDTVIKRIAEANFKSTDKKKSKASQKALEELNKK